MDSPSTTDTTASDARQTAAAVFVRSALDPAGRTRRAGGPGPKVPPARASSRRRRRTRQNGTMHVSAKVDYAMRALLVIAQEGGANGELIKGDHLASEQAIPARFLEGILRQLRQAGLIASQRGAEGGYRLARPASEITVADVVRALDGPLADVRGDRPENADYDGAAEHLRDVWIATRAALRGVLDHVTLAEIASGELPATVTTFTKDPAAWS